MSNQDEVHAVLARLDSALAEVAGAPWHVRDLLDGATWPPAGSDRLDMPTGMRWVPPGDRSAPAPASVGALFGVARRYRHSLSEVGAGRQPSD